MNKKFTKRAISKNYFHLEPHDGKIYDQRIVMVALQKGFPPYLSGLNPNNINTKILVYEDRVKEWFLKVGKRLKQDNEAGFIILQIALSYIEGNQQYRKGKSSERKSREFFIEGLKRIFPHIQQIQNIEVILNDFYKKVRCSLFHTGITGQNVTISGNFPDGLEIIDGEIKINPHKFIDTITNDFEKYINQLKDNNISTRKNFERFYNITG